LAITGAELVDPEAPEGPRATLLLEDGRIAGRAAPEEPLGDGWRIESRAGRSIAPGFLELHCHGERVAAPPARSPGPPARAAEHQGSSTMQRREWVTGPAVGSQPDGTSCSPYPRLYENNLAPVAAAGLRCRPTDSNASLGGVSGASTAFAWALWALDHLHWWA